MSPRTARERPPEEASIDTSFARGLRLLLMIADRGELRADELGAALEMPASTVYRYLRTLGEFGFVDRSGARYRLGPRLVIGAGALVTTERLIRHADPVLQELAAMSGETAVVMRRVALDAYLVHQVEAPQQLRVTLDPETRVPLWSGVFGRVLLAWAPEDVVAAALEAEAAAAAAGVPGARAEAAEPAAVREELAGLVRAGAAVGEDELVEGSVAVAAPILVADGIAGAVGIVGPRFRCDAAVVERVRLALPGAAARIAEELATSVP
ncbi:MAG: IclR family transcriptional regulator C-terminal domain-containing protein [Chloroflexota bacterium]